MPRALWLLLWLSIRSAFRRAARQARRPRGIAFLVVAAAVIVGFRVLPLAFRGAVPQSDPAVVRSVGPVLLLVFCLVNVLTSAGERAVSFTPAEVDFLFPGPFAPRQLLAYKLVKTALATAASGLLMGLFLRQHGGTFVGRAVGAWLTLAFFQLLAMTAALLQANAGERAITTARRVVLGGVVVAVAAAVVPAVLRSASWTAPELAGHLNASPIGRVLLAPFVVLVRAVTSPRPFTEGLRWDAIALAMNGAALAAVFALNANYLETASAASARRSALLSRVRKGGVAGMARAGSARLRVPPLPWLGGAGPIAWRQLTTAVRTARVLLLVLAVVAVGIGSAATHMSLSDDRDQLGHAAGLAAGYLSLVSLFLVSLLKFDFRGDLDHLDVLRSLPLRPAAVAAAELVTPTLVLTVADGLLLAPVALFGHVPALWVVAAAAVLVPVNAVVVAVENLLFLVFPTRTAATVAGDMGMFGRQSVVFFVRVVVLLVVGGACGGVGALAYWLTGRTAVAAVAAGVPLLVVIGLLVWLVGLAFDRLDPSVDTPA